MFHSIINYKVENSYWKRVIIHHPGHVILCLLWLGPIQHPVLEYWGWETVSFSLLLKGSLCFRSRSTLVGTCHCKVGYVRSSGRIQWTKKFILSRALWDFQLWKKYLSWNLKDNWISSNTNDEERQSKQLKQKQSKINKHMTYNMKGKMKNKT